MPRADTAGHAALDLGHSARWAGLVCDAVPGLLGGLRAERVGSGDAVLSPVRDAAGHAALGLGSSVR